MTWTYKGFQMPLNIKEIPDARPVELVNFLLQEKIEKEMKEEIEKLRKEKKELEEDKALLLAENRRLREANTVLRATVKRRLR